MKILFTGPSCFTGYWFVKELADAGHDVTATFRQPQSNYSGIRKKRVDLLVPLCRSVFDCPFGSEKFFKVIEESSHWDLLCHHAADVTNYKSPDFDYAKAVHHNTYQIKKILQTLLKKNCQQILITGSVFEQCEGRGGEGQGSDGLQAVSPYGLSKGLTSDVFKYYISLFPLFLKKFVIPNPFGPFEEERYTTSLMRIWLSQQRAEVKCPDYVRDNIHVSLLAKAYAQFALKTPSESFEKTNPSGYVESQGAFTARFSREMKARLSLPCEYAICNQTEFSEPHIRTNTTLLAPQELGWNEREAWDLLANYYQTEISS